VTDPGIAKTHSYAEL